MSKRYDVVPMGDMLDFALEVREMMAGKSREELGTNRMLQLAVLLLLQRIGEAARRVSEEGRAASGGVPWPQIVGMRHHLVHEYTRIDLDAVWQAATESVPALIDALESILPAEP